MRQLSLALVIVLTFILSVTKTAKAHKLPSWWLRAALCVHSHEGSWTANTSNGFYGGLQFLRSTWISSGGLRYASYPHYATPHEQLHVAYTLWQRAGWAPWPVTSRQCGLR